MLRNGLEPWHLLIVLAIVLLMFGSTKLPELARGMGSSIRIFKSEMDKGSTQDVSIESKGELVAPAEGHDPAETTRKTEAVT